MAADGWWWGRSGRGAGEVFLDGEGVVGGFRDGGRGAGEVFLDEKGVAVIGVEAGRERCGCR